MVRQRLADVGSEAEHVHVTDDLKAMVYRASYPARTIKVRSVPALFVSLVVSGGGRMQQKTSLQNLDVELGPGDIGIAPPNASGTATYPDMTAISVGISVESVAESFGPNWPKKLKAEALTRRFRDPLVEATMMDVGYTRAGSVADSTLLHAAHMIAHQLLEDPFRAPESDPEEETVPLSGDALARLNTHLEANLERHVTVEEMAQLIGISRHHFSRRFKAATGQSPHQFAIRGKLDHAARLLQEEDSESVISIAQKFGYANPAQFSKVFRQHFGLSPRNWRRRSSSD